MTKIDYIILAPIIFGLIMGFYRGFFKELVFIICIIVAIFLSRYFGATVANFLSTTLEWQSNITKPISFSLIFIGSILGLKIIARILTKLSKAIMLGWLNRLLGGILGGLKWLLITSVFINIISFFYQKSDLENNNKLKESRYYKPIESSIYKLVPLLKFDTFMIKNNNDTSQKSKNTNEK